MAKKFKLSLNSNQTNDDTVKDQIELIKNKKTFNLKFIEIEDMEVSPYNRFQVYKENKPEKFNEIKESIRTYGLLTPLLVVPVSAENHQYEILGGQNRKIMIQELISEGDTQFLKGIPCNVVTPETSETDLQILCEISNIMEGHTDPSEVQESVARLTLLYKTKNEIEGTNVSVTRQVAENLEIGERQVQKYNAVEKLIPELKDAFQDRKIALDNAASLANTSEEVQLKIAELIVEGNEINKAEIEAAKKLVDITKNQLKMAEEKLSQKEIILKNEELEKKKLKQELEEKTKELIQNSVDREKIEKSIQEELNKQAPNNEKLEEYDKHIQELDQERENLNFQLQSNNNLIKKQKDEIKKLLDEINSLKTNATPSISQEEQLRLKDDYEIQLITAELKKKSLLLNTSVEKFMKTYRTIPESLQTVNEILDRLDALKSRYL